MVKVRGDFFVVKVSGESVVVKAKVRRPEIGQSS